MYESTLNTTQSTNNWAVLAANDSTSAVPQTEINQLRLSEHLGLTCRSTHYRSFQKKNICPDLSLTTQIPQLFPLFADMSECCKKCSRKHGDKQAKLTYTWTPGGGSQTHSPVMRLAYIGSPVRGSSISTHSHLSTNNHHR